MRVEDIFSHCQLIELNYLNEDLVFATKSVRVNGIFHAIGLYVCLNSKGEENVNLPIFGKIKEIIIGKQSQVFLRTVICATISLDPDLNAYCVESDAAEKIDFRTTTRLADYSTFCTWKDPKSKALFISLRHILL